MVLYPITKTETGKPAIGIGGGSFTKRFLFRTVIRKTGDQYELKPAYFIRSAGDLSCQTDQGITEIEPGDIIIHGSGFLPIDPKNPGVKIEAAKIIAISADHALVTEVQIAISDLPFKVITGAGIYHNRDGSYFSGGSS